MQKLEQPKKGYKLVKSLFGEYEEIPEDWNFVKLDNVSTVQDGNWILEENYAKDGVRLLQVGDIGLGKFIDKSWKFISKDTAKELRCKIIQQEKDILISRMPDPVGRACLSPHLPYDYIVAVDVSIVKPKKETIVPIFLIYYINSQINLNKMQKYVTGTTRQRISRKNLEQTSIVLPSLPEQQKIVSILSNVDSLINQTQKEIEQTQRLKKGLIQKLLTKGIEHSKFKKVKWNYGKLLEIPENWDVVLLDHVAIRGSGHTPDAKVSKYYNGGIKWISLADSSKLDNVYISETDKEISQEGIENSSAVKHPPGVVVLSRDAGVGKSAITTTEMAVSQHFMVWQCGSELSNHFLYYLLQFWKPLFESIAIGTTIKTIGLPFFKKFKIILPSRKEQDVIASMLFDIDQSLWKQQEYKSKLETLKKGLMQKLLTGQIRVKV